MMVKTSSKRNSGEHQSADVQRAGFTVPRNVTAVKLMIRTATIYEVCAVPARGRQPEFGSRKKDDGGTLKLVVR
jgi:hypothetical protein